MEYGEVDCHISTSELGGGPWVGTLYAYDLSEGVIEYDGYFYRSEERLPVRGHINISKCEDKPYKVEEGVHHYKYIYSYVAEIEIYKHQEIKNTSQYSTIEEDGEEMNVCFFPTHHEKIWFRILGEEAKGDFPRVWAVGTTPKR